MEVNKSFGRIWKRHVIWKPARIPQGAEGRIPSHKGSAALIPCKEVEGREEPRKGQALVSLPANSLDRRVQLKLLNIDNGCVAYTSVIDND